MSGHFSRMFVFVRPHWMPFVFGKLLYSGQSFAFHFLMAVFSGNITAAIVARNTDFVQSAVMSFLILAGAFFVMLGVGLYAHIIAIEKITMTMKRSLFAALVRQGRCGRIRSADAIAAINTDANTARDVFDGPLTAFIGSAIGIVGSAIVIFAIDWRLGLAALGVGAISFCMQHGFTRPLAKIGADRLRTNAESVKVVGNAFEGAAAIRAYNMQPRVLSGFERENARLRLLDFRRGYIEMWRNMFGTVQGFMSMAVTFGLGGHLVITQRLEFHMLMVVLGIFAVLVSEIGRIGHTYADLQIPTAAAARVFAIFDNDSAAAPRKPAPRKPLQGYALSVSDLTFRYADAPQDALRGINLQIAENQMVAFVGGSGSGKSTLLQAIVGMFERDDLCIQLGNLRFADCDVRQWRQHFSYVDQQGRLFDMSIKENIAMGAPGAADGDIEHAAKQAGAHDFIMEMDGGYDAPCGESGGALSGGQRQRILIARALLKGAPILVFDEATSALDAESERHTMQTIEQLRRNHTILIVSHNPESVAGADMVVTLENGRVKSAQAGRTH